jgi:hypothetical protein
VALGVLIGMLAIWTPGAEATDGPDAPERVFALTINDKLLRFDGNNPSRVNSKEITGLVAGESLVGIDFRPSAQPPGSPNQGKSTALATGVTFTRSIQRPPTPSGVPGSRLTSTVTATRSPSRSRATSSA